MISQYLSPRMYRLFRRKPKVHKAVSGDRVGVGYYKASCSCGWKAKFGLYGEIHNGQRLDPRDTTPYTIDFEPEDGTIFPNVARQAAIRHMEEFNCPAELLDMDELERTYSVE